MTHWLYKKSTAKLLVQMFDFWNLIERSHENVWQLILSWDGQSRKNKAKSAPFNPSIFPWPETVVLSQKHDRNTLSCELPRWPDHSFLAYISIKDIGTSSSSWRYVQTQRQRSPLITKSIGQIYGVSATSQGGGANGGGACQRLLLSRPPHEIPAPRPNDRRRQGTVIYRVVARSHLYIYYTVRFPSESNI